MNSSEALYNWQTPLDMKIANRFMAIELGSDALRRKGREFRESFIAAHFSFFRNAEAVRLLKPGSSPTPDFAFVLEGKELHFEVTETDRPGRQRGSEKSIDGPTPIPDEDWVTSSEYYPVVARAALRKSQKQYEKCDGLIIYDNAWPIEDPEAMTDEWWRSATRVASSAFAEVWRASDGFWQIY